MAIDDLFPRFRPVEALEDRPVAPAQTRKLGPFVLSIGSLGRNLTGEQDRWLPWFVAAFASGALIFFALSFEPSVATTALIMFGALVVAWLIFRSEIIVFRFLCMLFAATGFGFCAAKLRTETIAAPILTHEIGPARIEGRIESVSDLVDGQRVIIVPSRLGHTTKELPSRIRLTLKNLKVLPNFEPGQWISVVAILRPPPEPSIPGGYDFARALYYDEIGALAFAFGPAKIVPASRASTTWEVFDTQIERLRHAMTKRVREILPGPNGAIATALITGDRGAIEEDDNRAFRDSGLAHILSISGVHMALAGLGIFWAIRAVLALIPRIVLVYPIKKWAAACAIGASFFYLMISGGGAAPTRAFIMLAMMLLGVLLDRPALTMYPVALAGLAILAVAPESVLDAGFQMSFAAIIGLIALAEWRAVRASRGEAPVTGWTLPSLALLVRRYFTGIVLVTTVATLATAPFAIFHFNRAGGYSILSNVLADFVVAFVVMPSAAIAVLLMPVGLDAWPLQVMGWGVQRMIEVAHWVGGLPGAVVLLPSWPSISLVLIALGGFWIGVWRRRWRWLGLVPVLAGLAASFSVRPPDILISHDAQMIGVEQKNGLLAIMGRKIDDYAASQWLLRRGDMRDWKSAQGQNSCDDLGCVAHAANNLTVALSLRADALLEDCERADILISAVPVRVSCPHPQIVIDRFDAAREGASALWFTDDGIRMETVAETRGTRPWVASQYRRKRPTSRP